MTPKIISQQYNQHFKEKNIFMKKIAHPNKLRTLINCAPFFQDHLQASIQVRASELCQMDSRKIEYINIFMSAPSKGILIIKLSRNKGCGKYHTFFCDQVRASELGQMVSKKIKYINIFYINPN